MKTNALEDCLEIWGFDKDFTVFADGSTGFGFKLTPRDVSCLANDQKNGLADQLGQFLNGLPVGVDIQFVLEVSSDGRDGIQAHDALTQPTANEIAKALTRQRLVHLHELEARDRLPHQTLYAFVRRSFTGRRETAGFFAKRPGLEPELATQIQATERLRDQIEQGLSLLRLSPAALDARQTAELIYAQWNPNRGVALGEYDPEDTRPHLLFTDAVVERQGFLLGGEEHRVLSLKLLPDTTMACFSSTFAELPPGCRVFLSVHVPDQSKELSDLQTQRRVAFSMAQGKRGVSDIESESKFQDVEAILEEMISSGEKVFRVSLNLVVRGRSQPEVDEKVAEALSVVRELCGAEAMEESLASFPVFCEFAIPNARAKERMRRMKTSNLRDFVPAFGSWPGHSRASILLRSRLGSLVRFDPFSPELTNFNHLISGGSGSGKSFLTNLLLLQMLKEDPKVFFVDIGGSYKKLSDNLSGQFIPLGLGAGLSFNPFDLGPGEVAPSDAKIKFLVGLVELMTKEDDVARLPKLERAVIEESIKQVYESSTSPRLSDLQKVLSTHADVEIRRYGKILSAWCGDSPYGTFVDRPTSLALEKNLVAFDLKGLESYPDLQTVCLYIITDFVWREVQKDISVKKFLVFDECWKLLKSEAGLIFIEEVFRTFRKYNSSAIAISQDMSDFSKSKIASAIMPNCSTKWLLLQNQVDETRMKEMLNLNENEVSLVRSLCQEKGRFSEAFLMTGSDHAVVVIESTPLEYWIATTDPKDLAALRAHARAFPDQTAVEHLRCLAEKFPRGVANDEKNKMA